MVQVMPYAEVLLDAEFTPQEAGTEPLPAAPDLLLTLGLSTGSGVLRTLRVGAFGARDLSRSERSIQLGGRAEVDAQFPFGPDLRFITLLDSTVYASTT